MKIFELQKILNVKKLHNLNSDDTIDYFRIVKYNDDKDVSGNVLYFPITISEEDIKKGWYINSLDYREKISEISKKNPDYIYVIEEYMEAMIDSELRYLVVDNIMASINILFKHKLSLYNGKIITITGSVGKTTTVGIIQQVLGNTCGRIYSKRITPLILQTYVINYLNDNLDYVVLEASLWYKEHITYFSETLKPDLAILMNVFPEHIGVKDINSVADITKYKSLLLEFANNAIVNRLDKEFAKINIDNNKVYYENEKICDTSVNHVINIDNINNNIKPYIKTELSLIQQTIAYCVGKYYGLNDDVIYERLSNIQPVENRIQKQHLYNHEIIFDGDVSGVARLNNLCNNFYDNCYLVLCHLTENGEEEEKYEEVSINFNKFSKVFVHDQYKKYYNDHENVIYFNSLEFIKTLEPDSVIIMHYGSYYRKFNAFSIENLEVDS